jgi:antitoxin component YwqK of YwqJK toxin-antitoxin module
MEGPWKYYNESGLFKKKVLYVNGIIHEDLEPEIKKAKIEP